MDKNKSNEESWKNKIDIEEDVRWLEMYHKTVVGLAALAEQHAEGCETGWMAMQYGLEDLAESMEIDINDRKEKLKQGK